MITLHHQVLGNSQRNTVYSNDKYYDSRGLRWVKLYGDKLFTRPISPRNITRYSLNNMNVNNMSLISSSIAINGDSWGFEFYNNGLSLTTLQTDKTVNNYELFSDYDIANLSLINSVDINVQNIEQTITYNSSGNIAIIGVINNQGSSSVLSLSTPYDINSYSIIASSIAYSAGNYSSNGRYSLTLNEMILYLTEYVTPYRPDLGYKSRQSIDLTSIISIDNTTTTNRSTAGSNISDDGRNIYVATRGGYIYHLTLTTPYILGTLKLMT